MRIFLLAVLLLAGCSTSGVPSFILGHRCFGLSQISLLTLSLRLA